MFVVIVEQEALSLDAFNFFRCDVHKLVNLLLRLGENILYSSVYRLTDFLTIVK
ncbi:hypothetical protein SDC9_194500 [bioreactor metagenome]|uniref:Uncharacterized protein n=1 Tax=bioreactor metagenome TaxID=1076179 RepID=A0A645I6G8_9ZZZZ